MRILSIDTCLAACSVAVLDGERVLAAISEPMVRGHQERLASMAREAMAQAGLRFGAPLLAEAFPSARLAPAAVPDPVVVARIAARTETPAKPLYLRAPDAVLPA